MDCVKQSQTKDADGYFCIQGEVILGVPISGNMQVDIMDPKDVTLAQMCLNPFKIG